MTRALSPIEVLHTDKWTLKHLEERQEKLLQALEKVRRLRPAPSAERGAI